MNITTVRDPRIQESGTRRKDHATVDTTTTDNPRYRQLPIGILQQGAGYQRPIDKDRVDMFVSNFDPAHLMIIDVALLDDGTFEVIDGQHRIEAAKLVGYNEPLLCHINYGLSYEERAKRFVVLNTTPRKPSELDLFWANVEAGSAAECNVLRIVRDSGYDIYRPSHPGGSPRSALQCVGSLSRAYLGGDEFVLSQTLRCMHDAGWHGSDIKSSQVRAISAFVIRYRSEYRYTRLVEVLSDEMPSRVVAGIRATQIEFIESGNKVGAHQGGTYILRLYNKGLRTRRLPSWESSIVKNRVRRASASEEEED